MLRRSIGAGIFVAITGPPKMKWNFFANGAKGQCVEVLCEYTFYQVLYYCLENNRIINKQCKNKLK